MSKWLFLGCEGGFFSLVGLVKTTVGTVEGHIGCLSVREHVLAFEMEWSGALAAVNICWDFFATLLTGLKLGHCFLGCSFIKGLNKFIRTGRFVKFYQNQMHQKLLIFQSFLSPNLQILG